MIRLPLANHPMAPAAVLGVAILASGLAVWPRPTNLDWSSADAAEPRQSSSQYAADEANAYPMAYRPASESRSETSSCNPWDVSPAAMQAILQEMVRRGWQPPRSDIALASTQPSYRTPIQALDPDRPVWIASPRNSAPVETGEIVDVTIAPSGDTSESSTQEPVTTPAPPTPSAPAPQPITPEAPASSN